MQGRVTTLIRIGGLGPLSPPGIPWAGRELLDGMRLAVRQSRALELTFEDTKGLPAAGVDAVGRLARLGVHALAGEYHSIVAAAVLDEVDRVSLPFVCASATLDSITSRRLSGVFRIAPPQSYGWRAYASYLAASGSRHVHAVIADSPYWQAGAAVIEARLIEAGVPFTRWWIDADNGVVGAIEAVQAAITRLPAPHVLLLLVGYPEPLRSIVLELRTRRLNRPQLILGDPAGRPGFPDWWEVAGADATGVPFLAYERPGKLTERGQSVARRFEQEYGREPSFVALEGYDSILALETAVGAVGSTAPADICAALRQIEIRGTRGTMSFSTAAAGVVHQQWTWAPTCVVALQTAGQRFSSSAVLWDESG